MIRETNEIQQCSAINVVKVESVIPTMAIMISKRTTRRKGENSKT